LWHLTQVLNVDLGGRIVLHLDWEHYFSEGVEELSSSLGIWCTWCRINANCCRTCDRFLHVLSHVTCPGRG